MADQNQHRKARQNDWKGQQLYGRVFIQGTSNNTGFLQISNEEVEGKQGWATDVYKTEWQEDNKIHFSTIFSLRALRSRQQCKAKKVCLYSTGLWVVELKEVTCSLAVFRSMYTNLWQKISTEAVQGNDTTFCSARLHPRQNRSIPLSVALLFCALPSAVRFGPQGRTTSGLIC